MNCFNNICRFRTEENKCEGAPVTPEECRLHESLKAQTEPVAEVPCSAGLDTLFFMKRRLPHLLNIAEELLTWCIEEDKKGIYRDYIKKYRKEHEDIIEKGV